MPNLKPGSSYVVCFETIHTSNTNNNVPNTEDCHETKTLGTKIDMSSLNFPITEVLISVVVSASVCICLAIMCCYLIPKLCRSKSDKNMPNQNHINSNNMKDENDNTKEQHKVRFFFFNNVRIGETERHNYF